MFTSQVAEVCSFLLPLGVARASDVSKTIPRKQPACSILPRNHTLEQKYSEFQKLLNLAEVKLRLNSHLMV